MIVNEEAAVYAFGVFLIKLGPVAQGSILERPDPRAPGRTRRMGPYYQWTRKIGGRTVNVNLSAAQAKLFGRAIAQHRRLVAPFGTGTEKRYR